MRWDRVEVTLSDLTLDRTQGRLLWAIVLQNSPKKRSAPEKAGAAASIAADMARARAASPARPLCILARGWGESNTGP